MNAFAPIFYVAFFKGRYAYVFYLVFTSAAPQHRPLSSPCSSVFPLFRFAGRPGDYVYVFGDYRMEEVCLISLISGCFVQVSTVNVVLPLTNICPFTYQCAPPGCLIELCIQLSMIMLGKQLIQNNVFEVLIPYVHGFFSVPHS